MLVSYFTVLNFKPDVVESINSPSNESLVVVVNLFSIFFTDIDRVAVTPDELVHGERFTIISHILDWFEGEYFSKTLLEVASPRFAQQDVIVPILPGCHLNTHESSHFFDFDDIYL